MTVTNSNNTFSASEIGSSFVETYYGTLTQKPQKLALLYKQDSQVTHTFSDSDSIHYQGKQIDAALQDLTNGSAKNVKVKFHLVESQSSIKDSLLVTVHGAFHTTNSTDVVNFYQSFVLATQKNGYYVLNDILRLDAKSPASYNIRDIEVDSTAATMGEGSVHSFSEEEIRSIEASNSVDDKDSTDLKEETSHSSKKHYEKKSHEHHGEEGKKKRQNKKKHVEDKSSVDQTAHKHEAKKQTATASGAPASYAAIVGGDEYATVIHQQPKPEKKKRAERPERAERTERPERTERAERPERTEKFKKFNNTENKEAKTERPERTERKKFVKNADKVGGDEQTFERKPKKKFERRVSPVAEKQTTDEDGFEQKKPKKYVKRVERAERSEKFKKFNTDENKVKPPKKIFNDDNKFGVYVARVEPNTTTQQLQESFAKYGEIVDMNNRAKANEKKPKFQLGYALVFYNNQESVNKAMADKEIVVNGQQVDVTVHSRKNYKPAVVKSTE